MDNDLIPFGKYKGQPVEQLQADPQYTEWLLAQPWFNERYSGIRTIIVNNFKEAADTPEHNAMQARFLDKNFAFSVFCSMMADYLNPDFSTWMNRVEQIDIKVKLDRKMDVEFEVSGWDVVIKSYARVMWSITETVEPYKEWEANPGRYVEKTEKTTNKDLCFGAYRFPCLLELKPTIGEDFPSVLRQVKSRRSHEGRKCVLIDSFQASSVSFDDVQKIFDSSYVNLLRTSDIEPITLPAWFKL